MLMRPFSRYQITITPPSLFFRALNKTRATSFIPLHSVLSLLCEHLMGSAQLWWNITYVENANPDGLFERTVIGVNDTWLPPPIDVTTNDTLIVHAYNALDIPTSLHHHGMFFNSTSWMDGAVGVSQCGIPSGETFDYVVPVNTSGQWGTYWVHAHTSLSSVLHAKEEEN
ncbi:hypothetical protein EW146_g8814 [Bondarzewia mesenterica]|uniref:Plastocyanin-like domain-containing protein n=1 Tax=Bondarzewia mesenterica TaxID=1095465 RepID=A0A4S4LBS6_9AGAM|nr:hypothetical protein EW146_g8814 [Bondarzewia mesenterica]